MKMMYMNNKISTYLLQNFGLPVYLCAGASGICPYPRSTQGIGLNNLAFPFSRRYDAFKLTHFRLTREQIGTRDRCVTPPHIYTSLSLRFLLNK